VTLATKQNFPQSVAVSGGSVFWVDHSTESDVGTVMKLTPMCR
jgi:hypothetical protein